MLAEAPLVIKLLRFVVLGAAIFFVSAWLRRSPTQIVLAQRDLDDLAKLDPSHASAVRERAIEDEILYREGLRLGFDRDDSIVRQRVIQKTLFLAEELAGASEPPTESELLGYFQHTRERWTRPARWTFHQVFAHDPATLDLVAARERYARGAPFAGLGDSSPIANDTSATRTQIANALGTELADALPTAPTHGVIGPLRSALGWHLVAVDAYEPEVPAELAEAHARVLATYVIERRQRAVAAFLGKAFAGYDVTIDGARVETLAPQHRVAIRKAASAED